MIYDFFRDFWGLILGVVSAMLSALIWLLGLEFRTRTLTRETRRLQHQRNEDVLERQAAHGSLENGMRRVEDKLDRLLERMIK